MPKSNHDNGQKKHDMTLTVHTVTQLLQEHIVAIISNIPTKGVITFKHSDFVKELKKDYFNISSAVCRFGNLVC